MTRLQELTLKLVDRELTADEEAELFHLTVEDPVARGVQVRILEIEAVLRAGRSSLDFAPSVTARLERDRATRTVERVIDRIKRPRRRWGLRLAVAGSLVATAALASWRVLPLLLPGPATSTSSTEPAAHDKPASASRVAGGSGPSAPSAVSPPTNPATASTASPAKARPLRGARSMLPPGADTLFAFDFEDGVLPAAFERGHGQVVTAPAGASSRYCLIGTLKVRWPHTDIVQMNASDDELFRYRRTLVVRFDYWLGASGMSVYVQISNQTKQRNYSVSLRNAPRETWSHAFVRLADVELVTDAQTGPAKTPLTDEGDSIGNIQIHGGSVGGPPFYVDNLRVEDWPAAELPEASTAGEQP